MEVLDVEVDWQAETMPVMGEPYAFVGGMIDLAPERAETLVVGGTVRLRIQTDDGAFDISLQVPAQVPAQYTWDLVLSTAESHACNSSECVQGFG